MPFHGWNAKGSNCGRLGFCGSRRGQENNCGKNIRSKKNCQETAWCGPKSHHEAILRMTNVHLAKSTAVVNRFDSPFYPEGSAEKWYANWISRAAKPRGTGCRCGAWRRRGGGRIFHLLAWQTQEDIAVYKGILSVIEPKHRGRNFHVHLQQFLFEEMATRHEKSRWTTPRRCPIIQSFEITRSQAADLSRLNSSCFAGHTTLILKRSGGTPLNQVEPSNGARNVPVWLSFTLATCSGVPEATMVPPSLPPSGPTSMRWSHTFNTSRWCSMTTTVLP